MKLKKWFFLIVVLVAAGMLAGCSGAGLINTWPNVSVQDQAAYLSYGSFVYALDLNTGAQTWKYPSDKADVNKNFYAAPAAAGNQLIVGSYNNILYSLDKSSGAEMWTFSEAKGRYIASPVVVGDVILAANGDRDLYALNLDGKLLWKYETKQGVWVSPEIKDTTALLAGMDHYLYALDIKSGQELWKTDLGAAVVANLDLTDGVVYAGTLGNELIAVDTQNGQVIWRAKVDGGIWAKPLTLNGVVYVGDQAGKAYAFDAKVGTLVWKYDAPAPVVGSGAVVEGGIAFPTQNGEVVAVNAQGQKLWSRQINGKLYSNLVLSGDKILVPVTQGDGNLALVALDVNGKELWSFVRPK